MWNSGQGPNQSTRQSLSILQIHLCPDTALNAFYEANPGCVVQDFHEQIDRFYENGVSAPFIIAPALADIGHDAQFVVANSSHAQVRWLDHYSPGDINADQWLEEILRLQIEHYKPDVLLFSGTPSLNSEFIRSLNTRPGAVVLWLTRNFPPDLDLSLFDLVLSHAPGVLKKAEELGAKHTAEFYPGCPNHLFEHEPAVETKNDILFCGSLYARLHPKGAFYLSQLASLSEQEGELSFQLRLTTDDPDLSSDLASFNRGECYGKALREAIYASQAIFDFTGGLWIMPVDETIRPQNLATGYSASGRIFLATGMQRLLIAETAENLPSLFEPGKEILLYSSLDELQSHLNLLKKNPDRALDIARAGRKRCEKDHSLRSRADQLIEVLYSTILSEPALSDTEGMGAGDSAALSGDTNFAGDPTPEFVHIFNGPLAREASLFFDLLRGIELLHCEQHTDALSLFDRVLGAEEPLSTQTIAELGKCLVFQQMGNEEDARALLGRLRNEMPNNRAIQSIADDVLPPNSTLIATEPPSPSMQPPARGELHEVSSVSEQRPERFDMSSLSREEHFSSVTKKLPPSEEELAMPESPDSNITQALQQLKEGSAEKALSLILEGKASLRPTRDLDYVRGLSLLQRGQTRDALFALREELRFFPDNEPATALHSDLRPTASYKFSSKPPTPWLTDILDYSLLPPETILALLEHSRPVASAETNGCFVECGVCGGGSSILLARVIAEAPESEKTLYSCDSFTGIPEISADDLYNDAPPAEQGWGKGTMAAPMSEFLRIAEEHNVRNFIDPIAGEFAETLPLRREQFGEIAFLHLDAKLYHSTRSVLNNLWEHLVPGGVLFVSSVLSWSGAGLALQEFGAGIGEEISFEAHRDYYVLVKP